MSHSKKSNISQDNEAATKALSQRILKLMRSKPPEKGFFSSKSFSTELLGENAPSKRKLK